AVLGRPTHLPSRGRRARGPQTKAAGRGARSRESRLWVRCHQDLPAAPAGRRWVYVFDREGDTTEALDAFPRQGKHYVVRSHSNRRIRLGHDGAGVPAKLHDYLGTQPAQGQRGVAVPAHDGQRAREAACGVAWPAVRIGPPRQPRGEHGREPLPIWAVRVWELEPPAGVKPLEWRLITNVAVATAADAQERVDWYELRWPAEE